MLLSTKINNKAFYLHFFIINDSKKTFLRLCGCHISGVVSVKVSYSLVMCLHEVPIRITDIRCTTFSETLANWNCNIDSLLPLPTYSA